MNGTSHRGFDAPSQVTIETPNGFTISIIDDGYGEDGRPYEAFVTTPTGEGMGSDLGDSLLGFEGKSDGGGIFGWLTAQELGALIIAVGELRLEPVMVEQWRWV